MMNLYMILKGYIGVLLLMVSSAMAETDQQAMEKAVTTVNTLNAGEQSELIRIASEPTDNELRQQMLLTALIHTGPSAEGDAFAKQALDKESALEAELTGSLAYLSSHPAEWMKPYATKYLADTYPVGARAMAAFLAGNLAMLEHKESLIAMLSNAQNSSWQQFTAYGLAYLTTKSELEPILQASILSWQYQRNALLLNEFAQADENEKASTSIKLLSIDEMPLNLAGAAYLFSHDQGELLKQYRLVMGDEEQVYFTASRFNKYAQILGYRLSGNINHYQIEVLPRD